MKIITPNCQKFILSCCVLCLNVFSSETFCLKWVKQANVDRHTEIMSNIDIFVFSGIEKDDMMMIIIKFSIIFNILKCPCTSFSCHARCKPSDCYRCITGSADNHLFNAMSLNFRSIYLQSRIFRYLYNHTSCCFYTRVVLDWTAPENCNV